MVEHVGERIKQVADSKGFSVKDLSFQTGKSTTSIYEIFKKRDVSSEILREFSKILEVPVTVFLEDGTAASSNQSAIGTGNVVGSGIRNRQSFAGASDDDDCPKALEALRREHQLLQQLVAAKDEMIAVLKQR